MKSVLKVFFLFLAVLSSNSAHAFFACFSADGNSIQDSRYFISVYEPTRERPNASIMLTNSEQSNIPLSFSCGSATFSSMGALQTEYACEDGRNTTLFVYVSKKGKSFLANLYSKELGLELQGMTCQQM